ncbi:SCY1-like protein 2 [Lineus longissimus]|uniref:SCY1-like protein 2 n=1 Tax=Lineus longissimus TaxID=88925 RepID=UPI00315DD887
MAIPMEKKVMEDLSKAARTLGFGTMDMLFKIKSTVSGALPGNPVTREFDVGRHVASAGPGLLWKVFDGYKKSTKEEASVFVFEKKQLERYSKRDKEIITETLKHGVARLTRLRHPKILSVLHPVEESRDSLAFATERVFASLANMLGFHENMPSPVPADVKDCKLYDLEIKYGLLQVGEGVAFLHNDAKMMHNNICPESIVIVKNGAWKMAGFDFCLNNIGSDTNVIFQFKEWDADFPHVAQPNLNFLAPEYILTLTCSTASDMYSLGILMYTIFNKGKPLFDCRNQMSTYKKNVEELRHMKNSLLGSIPDDVRDHVKMLLNAEPTVRPDAHQISKIPFFEDVGVVTLLYLDSLIQRDNLQKSQFFKGLPKVLEKMPARVCTQRILPALFSEFMNHDMIPFVLPSVLLISNQLSDNEFVKHVLPSLIPAFQIAVPIQISLIFIQNMNILLKKTPSADVKNHILPMIYRALEADVPQIQELCLNIIPTFASLIEYSAMKNAIMPRIKKLSLNTSLLGVRVNCLVCVGKLLEFMDKWYVLDEVLPLLTEIPSREPAVLMSILGIYQVAFSHKKLGITKDSLALKVLPYLIPLSIDSNLNLKQFNAFITVIKEMVSRVESDHRGKLEQLNSMHQEQRDLSPSTLVGSLPEMCFGDQTIQFGPDQVPNSDSLVNDTANKTDSMMEKLMSGFGISGMLGAAEKTKKPGENSPVKPAVENKTPAQPAKVNLTMEEKQKLARDQETQERLKSQQPLQAKTATSAPAKNKPKDLTASLKNTNFMSSSTSSSGSYTYGMTSAGSSFNSMSGGIGRGGGAFSGAPATSTMYGAGIPNMAGGTSMSGMNQSGFGTMGSGFNQPNMGMGQVQQKPPNKNVDLSAFDSLLETSSNRPRPSLNQMSQKPPGPVLSPGMMGVNQGMMGNTGNMMMTQPRLMTQPGMMGNQGIMGNQPMTRTPNPFLNQNSGMMNNAPNQGQKPSGSELADIFG